MGYIRISRKERRIIPSANNSLAYLRGDLEINTKYQGGKRTRPLKNRQLENTLREILGI